MSGVRRSPLGGDLRSLYDCACSADPLDCSLGDSAVEDTADADCNEVGLRSHFGPSAILQPETGAGSQYITNPSNMTQIPGSSQFGVLRTLCCTRRSQIISCACKIYKSETKVWLQIGILAIMTCMVVFLSWMIYRAGKVHQVWQEYRQQQRLAQIEEAVVTHMTL